MEAIKKSKIKKYQNIKSKMLDQSEFERNYVRDKKLNLYIDYKKHIFAVEYFSWRLWMHPDWVEMIEELVFKHMHHAEILQELIFKHI